MRSKTEKRIATAAACLAILGLVAYFVFELISGSTLRQLTNGRLDDADYWSDKPAILSAALASSSYRVAGKLSGPVLARSWLAGSAIPTRGNPSSASEPISTAASAAVRRALPTAR